MELTKMIIRGKCSDVRKTLDELEHRYYGWKLKEWMEYMKNKKINSGGCRITCK